MINGAVIASMRDRALAGPVIRLLAGNPQWQFADQAAWQCRIERLGITTLHAPPDPVCLATKGTLCGGVMAHQFLQQTETISDVAGQVALLAHCAG